MRVLPYGTEDELPQRVRAALGYQVIGWTELAGGTNNRLVRLETAAGPPLLAKFYHRDRWNRLEREFTTLRCLHEQGLRAIPVPHLASAARSYAVYSFEPGAPCAPAALHLDQLRAAATFAADLHRLSPAVACGSLPPAIEACFSLAEQCARIDGRLRAFEDFAARPGAFAEVRAFARSRPLREALAPLLVQALDGLTPAELVQPLPPTVPRLTSGDFGVHNLLVRSDGSITVMDFEWAGWDDPARLVMGFVAHGGSDGLSAVGAEAFLGTYATLRALPRAEMVRFERVGGLLDLEWVATYATALTAETVRAKRFATATFDVHAYLARTIDTLKARLGRAVGGGGYRFPAHR
jgi:aminoglycoside phosphotransferase (APT) family kinase protein